MARVAEITRNLLNLNRDSRAASSVSPSKLLDDSVALMERTIVQGRRRIQVTHGFDGAIEAYPSELRQVFTNVLRNAVEATSEGGAIRISTEPTHHGGDGGVLIKIVDDGVGIPDNFRSKLFSAFVTSKGENGTGLGLWVSRSIVQRHGGIIAIASNKDGNPGATVSIFLPSKIGTPGGASEAALRQASG